MSISFHYLTCLSSVFPKSFHISNYFSSIFSISFHKFFPHFQYLFTFQLGFLPYFDESLKCCDIRHGPLNYHCLFCFVFSFISPFLCFPCCFLFLISTSRHNITNVFCFIIVYLTCTILL
jgi:hypothetical protein